MASISSPSCSSSRLLHSKIHSQRRYGSKFKPSRLLLAGSTQISSPFPAITLKERRTFNVTAQSGEPLGPSPPPVDPSSSWKLWIVGMVISAILPFWKNKWWPLLMLKQNVEKVVDAVEDVAEIVESVAEGVEKVAEEVSEHLPEGGELQKAALFIEDVARRVGEDADLAGEIIDKVQEMENEVVSFFTEGSDQENGERSKEEESSLKKTNDDQNLKAERTTVDQENGNLKQESDDQKIIKERDPKTVN